VKPLYKEEQKISRRDHELRMAYESGLEDGAGVEHEFRDESEAFFITQWAKEHNVSVPKEYEILAGKWSWDVGHVETPNTDFNLTQPAASQVNSMLCGRFSGIPLKRTIPIHARSKHNN
jgi:hypothetical protein